MADYNPHAPKIAGEEWVPIRNETLEFNPHVNSFERGYGFTLGTTRRLDSVRAYVQEYPDFYVRNRVFQANIYQQGREDQSGPIRSVIIPCDNGGITGTGIQLFDATNVAQAVQNASSISCISIKVGGPDGYNRASLHYNVDAYANLLTGKRILGVNLLLGVDIGLFANSEQAALTMWVASDAAIINGPNAATSGNAVNYGQPVDEDTPISDLRLDRIPIGGICRFPRTSYSYSGYFDVNPWTYGELSRFEASTAAPARLCMLLTSNAVGSSTDDMTQALITYTAMEVFYCEEARSAHGYRVYMADDSALLDTNPINIGALPIYLRTPITHTIQPALGAGNYTVTMSEENMGYERETLATGNVLVPFNELRQLAEIPSIPAVQVNIPYPLETSLEETFTSETVQVIPQLTMHTSGGTMYECHPYGIQAISQVYGSYVPRQEIYIPETAQWSWARFYARRFSDTSVPLRLVESSTGRAELITPEDFDALDEVLDGFKQVDLEFDPPLSLTGGTVTTFSWTATGEQAGNRWEVLGANALAITGVPGDRMLPIASPYTLGIATYGMPVSGSSINLAWLPQNGPYVSSITDDSASDAVLILGQDANPITGFAVELLSQSVTGIGQNCGIDPCGIPTAILYNQITWPLPYNTTVVRDTFNRTVAPGGWGSPDIGPAYTIVDGTATDFSVTPNRGIIDVSIINDHNVAALNLGVTDFDITVSIGMENELAALSGFLVGILPRYTDFNNKYTIGFSVTPTTTNLFFLRHVGGVPVEIGGPVLFNSLLAGQGGSFKVRLSAYGSQMKVKAWNAADPEPSDWAISVVDATFSTTTLGFLNVSSNLTDAVFFADLDLGPPRYWFGYYELQRSDTVETDWQTIMQATDPGTTSFNDYEARTGIETSYRIRSVDAMGFPSSWSETITSTIPTPGVSGSCLDDGSHVLIFTTNEHQDGRSNLAYSSVWMDGAVREDFSFPEASFVQLQAMYDRDYFIAFHPSERGGDQFSRSVLVQAAAIAPETLPDFTGLRNMAWTSVSYVCVRDEEGNRWLASVTVPNGTAMNRRKLYVAQVNIAEVTTTPSPVDPSA